MRLAPRASAALDHAAQQAAGGPITPAQLLEGLLSEPEGIAATALRILGIHLEPTGDALDRSDWESRATAEAFLRDTSTVGTEHLLLVLLSSLTGDWRALRAQILRSWYDPSPGGEWRPAGEPYRLSDLARVDADHPVIGPVVTNEPVVGMAFADSNGSGASYGWAELASRRPVDPGTRFRIGSVTKIATTLLILQLRDAGKVSLDEPALSYLRSFPLRDVDGTPSQATLRELLTHTAGFPQGSGLRHYEPEVPSPAEYFADGIQAARPRGDWAYSNLGRVGDHEAKLAYGTCPAS